VRACARVWARVCLCCACLGVCEHLRPRLTSAVRTSCSSRRTVACPCCCRASDVLSACRVSLSPSLALSFLSVSLLPSLPPSFTRSLPPSLTASLPPCLPPSLSPSSSLLPLRAWASAACWARTRWRWPCRKDESLVRRGACHGRRRTSIRSGRIKEDTVRISTELIELVRGWSEASKIERGETNQWELKPSNGGSFEPANGSVRTCEDDAESRTRILRGTEESRDAAGCGR
jgi:hypothetical protein